METLETLIAFLSAAFAEKRGLLVLLAKKSGLDEWLQAEKSDGRLEFRLITGNTSDSCAPRVKLVLHAATLAPVFVQRMKANMPSDAKFHALPISNSDLRQLLEAAYTPLPKTSKETDVTTASNGTAHATATPSSDGRSEAARKLTDFACLLDDAKNAIRRVLQESDGLRGQVSSLELRVVTIQTTAAGVSADNIALRARATVLETDLQLALEQAAGLELAKSALEAMQKENASLKDQLTAAQARAAAAQTELAAVRQAGAQFMSMLEGKQS